MINFQALREFLRRLSSELPPLINHTILVDSSGSLWLSLSLRGGPRYLVFTQADSERTPEELVDAVLRLVEQPDWIATAPMVLTDRQQPLKKRRMRLKPPS
jgi:hypothetical protein